MHLQVQVWPRGQALQLEREEPQELGLQRVQVPRQARSTQRAEFRVQVLLAPVHQQQEPLLSFLPLRGQPRLLSFLPRLEPLHLLSFPLRERLLGAVRELFWELF